MSSIVGGLRVRMILDSLRSMVIEGLDTLNWFEENRQHRPVTVIVQEYATNEEVPINTLAISEAGSIDEPAELGSLLSNDTWTVYVDFYAENDALGKHLMGDVRDILRGKITSVDRRGPVLDVYDYREVDPPVLFHCEMADVVLDRAQDFPHPWQQHWYVIKVDVIDTYGADVDATDVEDDSTDDGGDA